jgi:hypothetical protein
MLAAFILQALGMWERVPPGDQHMQSDGVCTGYMRQQERNI